MTLTDHEQQLLSILMAARSPMTWQAIAARMPKMTNRALRLTKEKLVSKGVPVGSGSGKQCFSNGGSLAGGIYLIRDRAELADARAQYEAQAKRELQHAAQLETNYYKFYNTNLFGEAGV